MPCPIWPDHDAQVAGAVSGTGTPIAAKHVDCPVCGTFEVSVLAESGLASRSKEERWRLSWATRQASEAGSPLRLGAADFGRATESVAEPRPFEKLDVLLKLLVARTATFGAAAEFNFLGDWPLIYARGEGEAGRLVSGLAKLGYIETMPAVGIIPAGAEERTAHRSPNPCVSVKGWERVTGLPSDSEVVGTAAFVAMWFDASMLPAYDEGFDPTLYALGYDPIRIDREHHLGKVDDFIVASIRKSALLVADFTGHRGGVYFETGFAMGLGIPVVLTCRADQVADAHFETRQYNHLLWTTPEDLRKKLRERIEATIPRRPRPRS